MTLADVHETIKFPAKRVQWGSVVVYVHLYQCVHKCVCRKMERSSEKYNRVGGEGWS